MAEAPINAQATSDLQIINRELKTPKSAKAVVAIVQHSAPTISPSSLSTPISGKRKRLKPARYDASSFNAKKKRSPSKDKGKPDPSTTPTSLGKEIVLTKDNDTPLKILPTMVRAQQLQSSLGTDHPTFIKIMLKSHVFTCFWMGLPVSFCKSYLPKVDTIIVAEDENSEQYNLKFIANKTGLSAGWMKFALVHKLLEGDVLIFQLVESCKFKIYIVRANDSREVGGTPLNDTNSDTHARHMTPAITATYSRLKRKKKKSSKQLIVEDSGVNLEVEGYVCEPDLCIEEVKEFKDFHIMVGNRCIDSELSEEIRKSYYELCSMKKECLHDNVPGGLNYKLVAGMIGETVSIADTIKKCKATTSKEEFDAWDGSLKAFEGIGMKVGFIREKIHILAALGCECEDAKRYWDGKEEMSRNKNMIEKMKAKVAELEENNRKIDGMVGGLKEKVERYEAEFKEKVEAPW